MLMAEVLQFWHISCRFDIENMEWALTWELLELCKLLNIYAPKASTSTKDFTFNDFFLLYIYIYIYIYTHCANTLMHIILTFCHFRDTYLLFVIFFLHPSWPHRNGWRKMKPSKNCWQKFRLRVVVSSLIL